MDSDTRTNGRLLVDEKGTTFAEYGLVFIVIAAAVLVGAIATCGGSLDFLQHVEPLESTH